MRTKIRRLALLGVVMGGLLVTALSAPVSAAGTIQISGSGYYDDAAGTECGVPPAGFDSYAGLVLSGDLEGMPVPRRRILASTCPTDRRDWIDIETADS